MLIIADERMPKKAKMRLEMLGEVLWLEPQKMVYDSIASHPDIFFCQHESHLFASPQIPLRWENKIQEYGLQLIKGSLELGLQYPQTAHYNAVFAGDTLIHNLSVSDPRLLIKDFASQSIHVKQGYTRCNLLPINDKTFITSDVGIFSILKKKGKEMLMIDPRQIRLHGHAHGFAGGCFGRWNNDLIFCGTIDNLAEAPAIYHLLERLNMQVINLYDGPPTDVGSIFFIDNACQSPFQ
jgi:hypothetical protein